ncbi:MAG: hypothetical protein J2P50_06580, partial [Hyphomicrobiaceae bacterium]|nr:hypothetical protein [Hyphomicrobiaceae bacterium]
MRRLALIVACLFASAVLALLLVPAPRASALTTADLNGGLQKGAASDNGVQLVRDGRGRFSRGRAFGPRSFAFGPRRRFVGRGFYGPRTFAFRTGPRRVWRRGFVGPGFYGPRRVWHRGFVGPRRVWRRGFVGPRRVWRRGFVGPV